jgi:hypothetical protein
MERERYDRREDFSCAAPGCDVVLQREDYDNSYEHWCAINDHWSEEHKDLVVRA